MYLYRPGRNLGRDLWSCKKGGGQDTRPYAEAILAMDVTAVLRANDLFALAV